MTRSPKSGKSDYKGGEVCPTRQSSLPQFHTWRIAVGELDASIFEGTPDRFQRRGGASIRTGLDLADHVSVDARALR